MRGPCGPALTSLGSFTLWLPVCNASGRVSAPQGPGNSPCRTGGNHTGTAVVAFTRSSTKLVLQSCTLGCLSSVSMMNRL